MDLLGFAGSAGKHILIPCKALVTWSLCSQAANPQTMIIRGPAGDTIVDTTVFALDASNESIGRFSVPGEGSFLVLFPADRIVLHGHETMLTLRGVIAQTHIFAGEDGNDGDFQDAFAVITWFRRVG
jgi:hypothetical protein